MQESSAGEKAYEMTLHQGALYVADKCYYSGKDFVDNLYAHAWLLYEHGQYQDAVMFMDVWSMAMELAMIHMDDDAGEQFVDQWMALEELVIDSMN